MSFETTNNLVHRHATEMAEQIVEAEASRHDKRAVYTLAENAMFRLLSDIETADRQRRDDLVTRLGLNLGRKRK